MKKSLTRDFVLDCMSTKSRMTEYNGLQDQNLKYFFSSPKRKKDLLKKGIISPKDSYAKLPPIIPPYTPENPFPKLLNNPSKKRKFQKHRPLPSKNFQNAFRNYEVATSKKRIKKSSKSVPSAKPDVLDPIPEPTTETNVL